MRDYSKVSPRFWTGATGRRIRKLGPEAQIVALYLITCPSANMLGLYYLPLPTLCHETGISSEGALKALRSLSEAPSEPPASPFEAVFCQYDEHSDYVWLPEMARWQIGERLEPRDNRIKAIRKEVAQHSNSPFFNDFLERYGEAYHLDPPSPFQGPSKALQSPSEAPSEPLRSQKQEQEQDQNQEQEETSSSERPPACGGSHSEPTAPQRTPRRRLMKPTTHGAGEVIAKISLANGTEAPVTSDIADEWQKVFPGVDVRAELGRIRVYFLTNPQKRKTAAGIGRCITSWLGRVQDRGGPSHRDSHLTGARRDRSGAPLPPPKKTATHDIMVDGVFYREEYDVATNKPIRRWPHEFQQKKPQEEKK